MWNLYPVVNGDNGELISSLVIVLYTHTAKVRMEGLAYKASA